MRKYFFIILFQLFATNLVLTAQGLKTNTFARTCVFNHPTKGAYVETYITLPGNALKYIQVANKEYQAGIEINLIILDGNEVVNFKKYVLNTPIIKDTSLTTFKIMDQNRMSIPNKALSMEITLRDVNDSSNFVSTVEALLPTFSEKIEISDIQLIDEYKVAERENNFTKNGYELRPYAVNYFPSSRNKFIFYGEIYNTDKQIDSDQFLATFTIRKKNINEINQKFYQYTKYEKGKVISFLKEFDIADLPTGNYNLVIEIRNKKNELITSKVLFFTRANANVATTQASINLIETEGTFTQDYTAEQLNYFIDTLTPIANAQESYLIESLSPTTDISFKKKFLYNFWLKRDETDAYGAWKNYLELVKSANENFATPSKVGYRTDRGKVYLKYGKPSDIVGSVNEAGAYPYEIWFYTTLPDKQTNIGFAFYEPSMVSDDYILIHSNARGELHDDRWKLVIYEKVASPNELSDFDNTEVQDRLGGQRPIDTYNF